MKNDSKNDPTYFDMIRIKPTRGGRVKAEPDHPSCQWKGCKSPGQHRAPMGRGRDGEFYLFCTDHVRQYNASYNYFDGMSDTDVASFQKAASYGHRPTWKVAGNAKSKGARHSFTEDETGGSSDQAAKNAQGIHAFRGRHQAGKARPARRRLKPIEKKSLLALELPEQARQDEIKAQYKLLVKRHHPDANGGDRGSEEKLREIIQAYNYLKQVGLV